MKSKNNHGFILLLVIALIPLIGVMSAVLMVNSRHLQVQTRIEELSLRAKMACESGLLWAQSHKERIASDNSRRQIVLNVDDANNVSCTITVASRDDSQTVVQITGSASDRHFTRQFEKKLVIPASRP